MVDGSLIFSLCVSLSLSYTQLSLFSLCLSTSLFSASLLHFIVLSFPFSLSDTLFLSRLLSPSISCAPLLVTLSFLLGSHLGTNLLEAWAAAVCLCHSPPAAAAAASDILSPFSAAAEATQEKWRKEYFTFKKFLNFCVGTLSLQTPQTYILVSA